MTYPDAIDEARGALRKQLQSLVRLPGYALPSAESVMAAADRLALAAFDAGVKADGCTSDTVLGLRPCICYSGKRLCRKALRARFLKEASRAQAAD